MHRCMSKSRCGSRSVLFSTIRLRGGEHVGVLPERLVLALGHREDGHLGVFAQIPQRRADEVADVLDEQQRIGGAYWWCPWSCVVLVVMMVVMAMVCVGRCNRGKTARPPWGVEVAALAGVDLDRAGAGGADAVGVGWSAGRPRSPPAAAARGVRFQVAMVAHSSVVLPSRGWTRGCAPVTPCAKRARLAAAMRLFSPARRPPA